MYNSLLKLLGVPTDRISRQPLSNDEFKSHGSTSKYTLL